MNNSLIRTTSATCGCDKNNASSSVGGGNGRNTCVSNDCNNGSNSSINPMIRTIFLNAIFLAVITLVASVFQVFLSCDGNDKSAVAIINSSGIKSKSLRRSLQASNYEVWAADQSNSCTNQTFPGQCGGYLWIWKSSDIGKYIEPGELLPSPLSCVNADGSEGTKGPCNVLDLFPKIPTYGRFGQINYLAADSENRYVVASFHYGFVGVIDTRTKKAVALFFITTFGDEKLTDDTLIEPKRSAPICHFSPDNSKILISNGYGKALERIDVVWKNDDKGKNDEIIGLKYDKSATLAVGKNVRYTDEREAKRLFSDNKKFIGEVIGSYHVDNNDSNKKLHRGFTNYTPKGYCKENGCSCINIHETTNENFCDEKDSSGEDKFKLNGGMGGRENNIITSLVLQKADDTNYAYVTLDGGGMFVVDIDQTPMKIVSEYGRGIVHGTGGGTQYDGGDPEKPRILINAGVSNSDLGSTQSMFTVYAFRTDKIPKDETSVRFQRENYPSPQLIYQETSTNTRSLGYIETEEVLDVSGQIPYETKRRDAHGMVVINDRYIHVSDRIQNTIEVFDAKTYAYNNTYDLTSTTGKDARNGPAGKCLARSVMDDDEFPLNDPTPDTMVVTPDNKYIMVALRGPLPVTASHSSQGSCPGVGIIKLDNNNSGNLVEVLRTENTYNGNEKNEGYRVKFIQDESAPGGHNYIGKERSDVQAIVVVQT